MDDDSGVRGSKLLHTARHKIGDELRRDSPQHMFGLENLKIGVIVMIFLDVHSNVSCLDSRLIMHTEMLS